MRFGPQTILDGYCPGFKPMYARLPRLQAAQGSDQGRKIGRRRRFEAQSLLAGGMLETEQPGMQRLARKVPNGCKGLFLRGRPGAGNRAGAAVGGIADQRVPKVREM